MELDLSILFGDAALTADRSGEVPADAPLATDAAASVAAVAVAPHVLVLGLGESGFAMARWCATYGCALRMTDTREVPSHLAAALALPPAADRDHAFVPAIDENGARVFAPSLLDDIDLVALSPGLSPLDPSVAALLGRARERGLPVWGELEFFARALRALRAAGHPSYAVAITGTNGKTTTTAMTGQLVARAGCEVAVAGNISPAMLTRLLDAIEAVEAAAAGDMGDTGTTPQTLPQVWVLELSSFQLETAYTFDAEVGAVLNVTQDHLDWHGSMDAYAAAKFRIVGESTRPVMNRDDARCAAWLAQWRTAQHAAAERAGAEHVPQAFTFGTGEPVHPGDFGIVDEGGLQWLAQVVRADGEDDVVPMPGLYPVRRKMPAGALAESQAGDVATTRVMLDQTLDAALGAADAVNAVGLGEAEANDAAGIAADGEHDGVQDEGAGGDDTGEAEERDAGEEADEANEANEANDSDAAAEPTAAGDEASGDAAFEAEGAAPGVVAKTPRRRRKRLSTQPAAGLRKLLMPVAALRVRGAHNASNALAALALCRGIGLPLAPLLHGLRDYRGEPHRVESIATLNGVDYVDDSKATNVGATVAGLDGLAMPAILIAGGDGKGQDFSPLLPAVARWCKAVMLIGRDGPLVRAAVESSGVPLESHPTLEAAVEAAARLAQAGDVVLLSPACASFDMFRSYAHRAEVFRDCVHELAAAQGVIV